MTAPATAPHRVRIIGGQWKRSKLAVADAPGLRPTPDRVRVTLFDWLGADLAGWRCLDAFAGSGALGFEAASRGAAQVVLLERDARVARGLADAKQRLKADAVQVHCADALAWMRRADAASFDIVFVDPPFDSSLAPAALQAAARLVGAGGWLYLESDRPCTADDAALTGCVPHRSGRAGAVHFHLLRRLAEAAL